MRRGDHNARVGLVFFHQIGHGGRRHDPQQLHARADTAKAGGQRILEHIGGDARILADDHLRVTVGFVRQHLGSGPAQLGCQLAGQILIGDSSDSVCSK